MLTYTSPNGDTYNLTAADFSVDIDNRTVIVNLSGNLLRLRELLEGQVEDRTGHIRQAFNRSMTHKMPLR